MAITHLKNINHRQYINTIRIRVSRVWRPKKFRTESFDGLHYVLIDEKGDSIHAIVDEHDFDHTEKIKEGCIYDIYHVHVKQNSFGYKILNRELEIGFNEMSKIVPLKEDSCSIPKYAFEFLQFHQVEECFNEQMKKEKEQKSVILADMYGCIKTVVPERKVFISLRNEFESICEVTLENHRRETVKITLWGDLAKSFDVNAVQTSPTPIFAVFTSLKMKKYRDDITPTGTNHTCIIFNPELPQSADYEAEFNKPGDKPRVTSSQNKAKRDEEWKSILDLRTLDEETYRDQAVLCHARILRFPTHSGWWYNGCSEERCSRQLKQRADTDQFACQKHGIQTPLPLFRVYVTIKDDEDQITLTLMGKQAENFFGYTCSELLNKRDYKSNNDLPEEITAKKGERYLFELKINFNFNREIIVKAIHPDPKIEEPVIDESGKYIMADDQMLTTPPKVTERKRVANSMVKPLFIADNDKKARRQEEEATSTSTHVQPNEKQKIE